jgi:hypothetical protein
MLCEKMMLHCGHKLRMKCFEQTSVTGMCPLFECRCALTEHEQKIVANQVILWKTPMWELHQYGRPATLAERTEREVAMSKRPKMMDQCKGLTLTGKPCTCTAMRSNGSYCNKHVSQQITAM